MKNRTRYPLPGKDTSDPSLPSGIPPSSEEISLWLLRIVAFLCGAAVMALEIAGVRLLEPHFGSTIYVWGAIIGVFLGSLTLGYWLGGTLADRFPHLEMLGYIILAAALFTFLIPWGSPYLCLSLNDLFWLHTRWKALLGSLVLYTIPTALLGMISPFAVRLAARHVATLGQVAGSLYAISTFGSIVGTFLVSFFLTEYVGSKKIVWGIGTLLVFVSLSCLARRFRRRSLVAASMGLIGIYFPGWYGLARGAEGDRLAVSRLMPPDSLTEEIIRTESLYHQITVVDSNWNVAEGGKMTGGERARYMVFNRQIESGILLDGKNIAFPIRTACGYVRLLHLGVLVTERPPRKALFIGCGGGVAPQAFLEDYAGSIERIDVVDIDPLVFAFARSYFGYPDEGHPILHSHIEDGRIFLHHAQRKDLSWDYIVLDAYTAGGRIPHHLITSEFFAMLRERLASRGVVVANIITGLHGESSRLYQAVFQTLRSVFPSVYAFPRRGYGERNQNVIFVATMDPSLGLLEIKARFYRYQGTLLKQPDLAEAVENVQVYEESLFASAPLLTDDFCPTDSMVVY